MSQATIFSRIIAGEIPAQKLFENEHCIAIKDIAPQAPVHVLIIPRRPLAKLADAGPDDKALLGELMYAAGEVARQLGVADAFRIVINNGVGAGQTVFHLHIHLLAGETFSEGLVNQG